MGRVTYTHISIDAARNNAVLNTNLSNFSTQSASLDEDNFRDEGLDHTVLDETELVTYSYNERDIHSGTTHTQSAATALDTTFLRISSITVPANAVARIRGYVHCPNDSGNYGLDTGGNVLHEFELWQSVSSSASRITGSTRSLESTNSLTYGRSGSVQLEAVITEGTYDWVEIRARSNGGGTIHWCAGSIEVAIFPRSV